VNAWGIIALLSGTVGAMSGALVRGGWAVFLGAALPWLGLLAYLLYNEYVLPYRGGGASMWPVAQLFGGTLAAFTGASAALAVLLFRRWREKG